MLSAKEMLTLPNWRIGLMLFPVMLGAAACQPVAQTVTPTCDDFLARWDAKPAALQFTQCERVENSQVDRFVASYVAKGTDAAAVETFLQHQFDMAPLKFLCCGWEPIRVSSGGDFLSGHGKYEDEDGVYFEVTMVSGETLVRDRKDWKTISEFQVRVTTYLGEF